MRNNNCTNNIFLNQKVVFITTNYTALANDVIIEITSTATPRSITLPAPSTNNVGKFYVIKDSSGGAATNNITIVSTSGTIDGAASVVISQNYGALQVFSDGTNYFTQALYNPLQAITLASGNWNAYSTTLFTPSPTVVALSTSITWTTLFPLSARVSLSGLTQVFPPVGLSVATQSITILQTGFYFISFTYTGAGAIPGTLVSQLVNNGTILSAVMATNGFQVSGGLTLNYISPFVAGNVIDVRVGNTTAINQFYCMNYSVLQLF